jgi:membrane-associated phospholipid phosphatase
MDLPELRVFLARRFSPEGEVGLYFTVGFVVSAVLAVMFGVLADEIFEVTTKPQPLDFAIGGALAGLRSPALTRFMKALTFLGSAPFVVALTALVIILLLVERHMVSALLFAGSVVGGFGLESTLKVAFGRARPDLWPALVTENTYSFPSGHATMSTVLFGGVVAVVVHLSRRRAALRPIRTATLFACLFLVVGVALSRIYLGAHWASDTVAGVMVGLFWVTVYATGTEYFARR